MPLGDLERLSQKPTVQTPQLICMDADWSVEDKQTDSNLKHDLFLTACRQRPTNPSVPDITKKKKREINITAAS